MYYAQLFEIARITRHTNYSKSKEILAAWISTITTKVLPLKNKKKIIRGKQQ
jgi:hypothetical protein